MRAQVLTGIAVVALGLAGCAVDTPAPETPTEPDPGASEPTVEDCLVGGPWMLDLVDYAEQAEQYMQGLGIPITDFVMDGSQTVQFTADGLMSVETGHHVVGHAADTRRRHSSRECSFDHGRERRLGDGERRHPEHHKLGRRG